MAVGTSIHSSDIVATIGTTVVSGETVGMTVLYTTSFDGVPQTLITAILSTSPTSFSQTTDAPPSVLSSTPTSFSQTTPRSISKTPKDTSTNTSTGTSTPPPTPPPESASLSTGTKAAIGLGVAVGVLLILGGALFFWFRRRQSYARSQSQRIEQTGIGESDGADPVIVPPSKGGGLKSRTGMEKRADGSEILDRKLLEQAGRGDMPFGIKTESLRGSLVDLTQEFRR